MRHCAYVACGKILVQREDETNGNFKDRICCNKRCAGLRASDRKPNKSRPTLYPSSISKENINAS